MYTLITASSTVTFFFLPPKLGPGARCSCIFLPPYYTASMALPRHLKNGLTPLEIEFLAENEPIEIAAAIDTRQDLELIAVLS